MGQNGSVSHLSRESYSSMIVQEAMEKRSMIPSKHNLFVVYLLRGFRKAMGVGGIRAGKAVVPLIRQNSSHTRLL